MLHGVCAWQCVSLAVLKCVDQFRAVRMRRLHSTVLPSQSSTLSKLACVTEFQGRLFITQWQCHHILVIFNCATDRNPITTRWGSQGQSEGEFHNPRGLAVHEPTQTLLVCDYHNRRIQVWDATHGTFLRLWRTHLYPDLVCVAPTSEVLVSDANGTVDVFDFASGQLLRSLVKHCNPTPVCASPSLIGVRGDVLLMVGKLAAHFNAHTGEFLRNRPAMNNVACLVRDTQIVSTFDWLHTIHVWRAADLATVSVCPGTARLRLATTASRDGNYWFVLWQQNGLTGLYTGVDVWRIV